MFRTLLPIKAWTEKPEESTEAKQYVFSIVRFVVIYSERERERQRGFQVIFKENRLHPETAKKIQVIRSCEPAQKSLGKSVLLFYGKLALVSSVRNDLPHSKPANCFSSLSRKDRPKGSLLKHARITFCLLEFLPSSLLEFSPSFLPVRASAAAHSSPLIEPRLKRGTTLPQVEWCPLRVIEWPRSEFFHCGFTGPF